MTAAVTDYRYTIDECTVLDKGLLSEYREKRSHWIYQLIEEPVHSVSSQITSMLFNDAVFRTINESRRISLEEKIPSVNHNSLLAGFVDQGFVAIQTLWIRRLLEREPKDPKKQVISLRRVLDDIRAHKRIITRENYVCHDGIPYDPDPIKRAYFDSIDYGQDGVHSGGLPTSGPDAWYTSEMLHENFDKISRRSAVDRKPNDLIHDDVFEKIERLLESSNWTSIKEYGNKFIAHSADEYSRSLIADQKSGLSLNAIGACHRVICQVNSIICTSILWDRNHGGLPTPQYDHLEYLDAPWLSQNGVQELRNNWESHSDLVEAYAVIPEEFWR